MDKILPLLICILCYTMSCGQGVLTFTYSEQDSKDIFRTIITDTTYGKNPHKAYFKETQCALYTRGRFIKSGIEQNLAAYFPAGIVKKITQKQDTNFSCNNWGQLFANEKVGTMEFVSRKFYPKFQYKRDSIIQAGQNFLGQNSTFAYVYSLEVFRFNIDFKNKTEKYAIVGAYFINHPLYEDTYGTTATLYLFKFYDGKWGEIKSLDERGTYSEW